MPRVAVIGGGISGLSVGNYLQNAGIPCTVFDTGKYAPGGRCSSRFISDSDSTELVAMDHSAQFFYAKSDIFRDFIKANERKEILRWNGPIGILSKSENTNEITNDSDNASTFHDITDTLPYERYVGKNGMRSLGALLAKALTVENPSWISKMTKLPNGKWQLYEFNKNRGIFDIVVIAHNGKCADKLLSTTKATKINSLLKVSFNSKLPNSPERNMKNMILSSLWVMVFVVDTPLPLSYDAAFVDKSISTDISYISCTTRKIRSVDNSEICSSSNKLSTSNTKESWTIISTTEFGSLNKVPQENIPPEKEKQIKESLLNSFARAVNIPIANIQPVYTKIQLWGAAVPLNRHTAPYIIDGNENIAICGDWFTSSPSSDVKGPCIESAWCSGRLLGQEVVESINKYSSNSGSSSSSSRSLQDRGLENHHCFEAYVSHPLGDIFPKSSSIEIIDSSGNNSNGKQMNDLSKPDTAIKGPTLDLNSTGKMSTSSVPLVSSSSSSASSTASPVKRWVRKQ